MLDVIFGQSLQPEKKIPEKEFNIILKPIYLFVHSKINKY